MTQGSRQMVVAVAIAQEEVVTTDTNQRAGEAPAGDAARRQGQQRRSVGVAQVACAAAPNSPDLAGGGQPDVGRRCGPLALSQSASSRWKNSR